MSLSLLLQEDDPAENRVYAAWKEKGELREERTASGTYELTLSTQRGAHDVTPFFEKRHFDTFLDDFLEIFDWTLRHSRDVLDGPVKRFHIVLVDGYRKNTLSSALRGTNVICCEVSQWHERLYSRESRKAMLYLSAAHEEYHVQTYAIDPDETKGGRELSAMIWEAAVLVKREKIESLWGMQASNKKQVNEEGLDAKADFLENYNAPLTRGLAYTVANLVYRAEKLKGLERFAKELLYDPQNGEASFDAMAEQQEIDALSLKLAFQHYREFLAREK